MRVSLSCLLSFFLCLLDAKTDERPCGNRKGSPPMVKIAIKTVGKRQVTLVSGHEAWGLFTSEELAEDLRHKAASSTAGELLFVP